MNALLTACRLWPSDLRNTSQFWIGVQSFSSSLSSKVLDVPATFFEFINLIQHFPPVISPAATFPFLAPCANKHIAAFSREKTDANKLYSFSIASLFFYSFYPSHLNRSVPVTASFCCLYSINAFHCLLGEYERLFWKISRDYFFSWALPFQFSFLDTEYLKPYFYSD